MKASFFLFLILFILNFLILFFALKAELLTSALMAGGYALFVSTISSYLYTKKVEKLLGVLLYFAEFVYENKQNLEETVIYTPLYEELQELVRYIEETIKSVKGSVEKQFSDLHTEYTEVVQKLGEIMETVEMIKHGSIEYQRLPTGLDPAGALGEILRDSLKELSTKIDSIKRKVYELGDTIKKAESYAEAGERELLEAEIRRSRNILEEIEKELEFFK